MSDNNEDKTIAISGGVAAGGEIQKMANRVLNAPKAKLLCTDAAQIDGTPSDFAIVLDNDAEMVVGRDEACSAAVPSRKLSRKHARIFAGAGVWGVEDLHSTNGVFVNGQRVSTAWLKHDDEVRFGPVVFRFLLDRPDLSAAAAHPILGGHGAVEEDDAGEKTMMFGSLKASEAVLTAMKAPEPEPPKKPSAAQTVAHRIEHKAETEAGKGKGVMRIAAAVLVVLVLGGGVYGYLQMKKAQAIEEAVAKSGKVAAKLFDAVRERPATEVLNGDWRVDLSSLEEPNATIAGLVKSSPGEPTLVGAAAKIACLKFERQFVPLVVASKFGEAAQLATSFQAGVTELGKGLPTDAHGVEARGAEDWQAASELANFAALLVDFRRFAVSFPDLAGAQQPTRPQVEAMVAAKAKFSEYRRGLNKVLSVYYFIFRTLVNDVEDRDIPLVNRWKDQFDRKGG